MTTAILSEDSSIVNEYLRQLRDVELQSSKARFGQLIERLGVIAGYELSKRLNYSETITQTPLADAPTSKLADQIVLATILRAGLPLQQGLHQVFEEAEQAFVAAARKSDAVSGTKTDVAYVAGPELKDKVLIMADVMLATGHSMLESYQALLRSHGQPKRVFIVAVLASKIGIEYIQEHIPEAELIVCTVDEKLNDNFYIVPGLGDAGDLLYGPKL